MRIFGRRDLQVAPASSQSRVLKREDILRDITVHVGDRTLTAVKVRGVSDQDRASAADNILAELKRRGENLAT